MTADKEPFKEPSSSTKTIDNPPSPATQPTRTGSADASDALSNRVGRISLEPVVAKSVPAIVDELVELGFGSFGRVSKRSTMNTVYKTTFDDSHYDQLALEFEAYQAAYTAMGNSQSAGGFWVPRAWALWRPETRQVSRPNGSPTPDANLPRPQSSHARASGDWFPTQTHPTLVLDNIPSLHPNIGRLYRELFWGEKIKNKPYKIRMLRLYFGRENFQEKTEEIPTGLRSDPPLDIRRYTILSQHLMDEHVQMPTITEISAGMGVALAQLHWMAGLDCRDAELVIAADPSGHGVQCYIFDFNQASRWLVPGALELLIADPNAPVIPTNKDDLSSAARGDATVTATKHAKDDLSSSARRLAPILSYQELYYPRPHQTELYNAFKDAYLATLNDSLLSFRPEYGEDNQWDQARGKVVSAADALFQEFQRLDAEKIQQRDERAAAKARSARSKAVGST